MTPKRQILAVLLLTMAVSLPLGTAVLAPLVGEAIGAVIGQVVGWLVDTFVTWLTGLFNDNVFAPATFVVKLPTALSLQYDKPQTLGWTNKRQSGHVFFNGFGGSYRVNLHWQVAE